jgi:hypothetical protein
MFDPPLNQCSRMILDQDSWTNGLLWSFGKEKKIIHVGLVRSLVISCDRENK